MSQLGKYSTGLTKKLVQVFSKMVWKSPDEFFGQLNTKSG